MISRIDSNDWRKVDTVDILTQINGCIAAVHKRFPDLHIYFESAEKEMPLSTNKILAAQVFSNLISNAAEYTPKKDGELRISVSSDPECYHFICKDNGIGIPKSDQTKIFSKFFRASNATDAKESGTGLGLYIVKTIVDSFGWNISFSSASGKGTAFSIAIPKK